MTFVQTSIAMIAFAANPLLCRLALREEQIDAASFATVRVISGALVLALILLLQNNVDYRPKASWWSTFMLFTYMVFFSFAYLSLGVAAGALVLFLGWEGVGLASYLLIGFWYEDMANSVAGKKAFVVNRIGDFGFLLGMFLIGATLLPHLGEGEGLFSFQVLQHHAGVLAPVATAIGLLLFVGATGKSAQIPLYIWLPDAMAGPTPVSALIHAATMVTAGVYMVARMNFLFVLSPVALCVVAGVGATTALFAATIARARSAAPSAAMPTSGAGIGKNGFFFTCPRSQAW